MYKNKYKENYITVMKALEKARIEDSVDGFTRLYITNKNGLSNIPYLELKDIIKTMQQDKIIEINHNPITSELLEDNQPKYHSPEFAKALEKQKILHLFPRPIWPMNYFSLTLEDKFQKLIGGFGPPLFLLPLIPSGKAHYNHRVITELLIEKGIVPNYEIAIKMRIRQDGVKLKKIKKDDYFSSPSSIKSYDEKIKNTCKTLKKLLGKKCYTIKLSRGYVKLAKLKPELSLNLQKNTKN